jgi:predicted outer membrane repeat protein
MLRMYLIQCIPIPCYLTLIMIKRRTVTVNNLLYTCVCCNNTLYRIRTFNRLYSCNLFQLSIYTFIASKNEILNSTTTFGGGIYSRTVKVYSFI